LTSLAHKTTHTHARTHIHTRAHTCASRHARCALSGCKSISMILHYTQNRSKKNRATGWSWRRTDISGPRHTPQRSGAYTNRWHHIYIPRL